jgi:Na+-translocating ferredoxin:NAD+ oxidoreductase RnfE subunit
MNKVIRLDHVPNEIPFINLLIIGLCFILSILVDVSNAYMLGLCNLAAELRVVNLPKVSFRQQDTMTGAPRLPVLYIIFPDYIVASRSDTLEACSAYEACL